MTEGPLRERRRRQTEREIADVALDLFERQGVEATTVEEVARAAGVSPRTFFRYFATKERAALVPHVELEERAEAMLDALDPTRPLLPQLEALWREILVALDDGRSEAGRLLLRVRRLILAEPAVRMAAQAHDEERAEELVARLATLAAADDDLGPRVAVETTSVVVRVALDRWARDRDRGARTALVGTYDEACRLLREVVAAR